MILLCLGAMVISKLQQCGHKVQEFTVLVEAASDNTQLGSLIPSPRGNKSPWQL